MVLCLPYLCFEPSWLVLHYFLIFIVVCNDWLNGIDLDISSEVDLLIILLTELLEQGQDPHQWIFFLFISLYFCPTFVLSC